MAEQRMQHEQERTRLQQQHSAEKDSLVQERQREVSSLERQARATLQQHQQHTQEWRKRDAQVGGLHWSMFVHRHMPTQRTPVDNHFVFSPFTFSWGFKAQWVNHFFTWNKEDIAVDLVGRFSQTTGYFVGVDRISIFVFQSRYLVKINGARKSFKKSFV